MIFDITEDEALVIESELPEVRTYWNVQVIDGLWNQVDIPYRQSSLNGLIAAVDKDGRFRAVVAHEDPGLANWLDTGGSTYGMLIGRWYRCSSTPTPQVTKIRLADVASHLDARSPRLGAEERAAQLRQRLIGNQICAASGDQLRLTGRRGVATGVGKAEAGRPNTACHSVIAVDLRDCERIGGFLRQRG